MHFLCFLLALQAGQAPAPLVRWEPVLAPAVVVSQESRVPDPALAEALPAIPDLDPLPELSPDNSAAGLFPAQLAPAKVSPAKAKHRPARHKASSPKPKS